MTISMYKSSAPIFIHGLGNLQAIIDKAEKYAATRKIEPSVLVNARLAPDMFPFSRQIQIATDVVKGGMARLAGAEIPSYADTEKDFGELNQRIAKTIKFIESFKPEQIDGSEEKAINLKVGGYDLNFTGQSYLLNFVVPNFYFHLTTAYDILRHNGLDIGKADFLGKI